MKTNQFRAMMLVLLMAVVSLGMVRASYYRVGYCDGCKGWNSACWLFGTDKGYYERYGNEYEWPVHDTG